VKVGAPRHPVLSVFTDRPLQDGVCWPHLLRLPPLLPRGFRYLG